MNKDDRHFVSFLVSWGDIIRNSTCANSIAFLHVTFCNMLVCEIHNGL